MHPYSVYTLDDLSNIRLCICIIAKDIRSQQLGSHQERLFGIPMLNSGCPKDAQNQVSVPEFGNFDQEPCEGPYCPMPSTN